MPLIRSISTHRIKTNVPDIDTILGGGFIKGSAILLAGEPGSGKSTLLLQLSALLSQENTVLYVSGEESLGQIKMRADRLHAVHTKLFCSETVNLEELTGVLKQINPKFIIIDSLQMMESVKYRQAPGTPTQVRYVSQSLIAYVKRTGKIIIFIGHSTKDGKIAGAQAVQHMVDATMFLAKGTDIQRKLLVDKNRFGEAPIGLELYMQEEGFDTLNDSLVQNQEIETEEVEIPREHKIYTKKNIFPAKFTGKLALVRWLFVCGVYSLIFAVMFVFFVMKKLFTPKIATRVYRV